ncbi:MAG: metal-dependent hydrolase [Candidatus Micrarchaeia archaeon]
MNAFGHLVAGAAAAALAASALSLGVPLDWTAAAVVALGALAPDADNYKSKLFRFILAGVALGAGALVYSRTGNWAWGLGAGLLAGILVLVLKPRHRGFTHSLACLALFSAALAFLAGWPLALLGGAAYASHLAVDGTVKLF